MKSDVVIGALLFVLSAAMFALTFQFPEHTVALSPTFFPRIVAVGMAGLSCLLIARALVQPRPAQPAARLSLPDWARQGHVRRIAVMAALGFIYTLVLDSLGFLVATALLLAATVVLFMERRLIVIVPVAVLGSGALYGIFRVIFKVPLPRFDLF